MSGINPYFSLFYKYFKGICAIHPSENRYSTTVVLITMGRHAAYSDNAWQWLDDVAAIVTTGRLARALASDPTPTTTGGV
jgi:hypothetical protein